MTSCLRVTLARLARLTQELLWNRSVRPGLGITNPRTLSHCTHLLVRLRTELS